MDTNDLRYFAAVAKYGSISQAAKATFISQPQLSHIIRKLENEMGVTLFRRTSHGTKLTSDGQRILMHSQVILKEMDRLQLMVSARKVECSSLNVSMTRFSHTAECYNEICRRYQDIDSFTGRLHEASPLEVINDVKEGRSSLGVIHTAVKEDRAARNFADQGLEYIPLATIRPYVCMSSEHELVRTVGRRGIDIRELLDYGFVRYIGQYPPYTYLISLLIRDRDQHKVDATALYLKASLHGSYRVIGIIQLLKINDYCRSRIVLKGKNPDEMKNDVRQALQADPKALQAAVLVDVNPMNLE